MLLYKKTMDRSLWAQAQFVPSHHKPEEDYKELGSSHPDRAEITFSNYNAYR